MGLQRQIIEQCLRIIGPTGVLLYNYGYDITSRRRINLRHDILTGFPSATADHLAPPDAAVHPRGALFNRLPNNYGVICVFSGIAGRSQGNRGRQP